MFKQAILAVMISLLAFSHTVKADAEADYQEGLKAYQTEDVVTAMIKLESAAKEGHVGAELLLAYIYDKAEQDEEAMRIYLRLVGQGIPEAMLNLGEMYANGEGVAQDYLQAKQLMELAATRGNTAAMVFMGKAYRDGGLGLEIDLDIAREWFQLAIDNGGGEPAQNAMNSLQK